jgi:hypothetical protein
MGKSEVQQRLGDETYFEADAPPQFFAATDEELRAAFPPWQPLLSDPVERWFDNPFTKEPIFGKTRVPEHVRKTQPRGWVPDLSRLPRSKRVPLEPETLGEFFDRLVDRADETSDEDFDELARAAEEACPLYEPLDCSWDVVGILPRWLEVLETGAIGPRDIDELIIHELEDLLRARTPGQRLFFVCARIDRYAR